MGTEGDSRDRVRLLEAELAGARACLRTLVESLPFDLWMMGADGRYTVQNETARRRWCDAVGRRLDELPVDDRMRDLWAANNRRAFAGETIREEVSYPVDGELRYFLNIIAPIVEHGAVRGILGVNIDVTDRKRFDEQSQRVQRVDSLGVLAAGLAHDFNNQLMAILGMIALARRQLAPDSHSAEQLVEAENACRNASALTRQFLTFARGADQPREVVDLAPLVCDAAVLATRGSSSRCQLQVESELWAKVDAGQVRQVVHNLVLNAVQAMPSGGVVRVAAGSADGTRICVRVEDEGVGISDRDMARVFDPYFTTKQEGRGLGLAVVQSIVHKHGGTVSVRSTAGVGTTFEILLPAAAAPPGEQAAPHDAPRAIPARVLVVDDQPELRRILTTMLREEGFDVDAADGTAEATEIFRREHEAGRPFGMAVVDMTLRGGPSGAECLTALRAIHPRVAAVAMSGYTDTPAVQEPGRLGFGASLAKPFTREQLLDALGRASSHGGS